MTRLVYTPAFAREYRRLIRRNSLLRSKIKRKINFFLKNPHHPSLKIHKVYSPKVGEVFSFSVDKDLRILFRWQGNQIIFYRIGSHNQIY